jgi:hypothetical protein
VAAGQDPLNQCADQGAASCGTDGACNGMGACRLYAAGTQGCGPAACAGGVESAARTCDGAGACRQAVPKACSPYGCNGARCATSCAVDSDCMYGFWCNGGTCADLSVGLIGWWKFEETSSPSRDSSGNGQNGVWEGAPTADMTLKPPVHYPGTATLRCQAASMARVHVTRTATLEPTGAISVSVWLRRSGPGTGWGGLFRKTWMNNMSPTYGSYGLQLISGDWSEVGFGTGHAGGVDDMISPTGTIPDNTWVHVAAVYDPAGAAPQKRLYVNGALVTSKSLTAPVVYDTTATGDFYICDAGGANAYFNGNLDALHIYGRALAVGEIRAMAAGQ